nr:hypothetical protein Iba_chr04aCG4360 [Ipomoea batatas]
MYLPLSPHGLLFSHSDSEASSPFFLVRPQKTQNLLVQCRHHCGEHKNHQLCN